MWRLGGGVAACTGAAVGYALLKGEGPARTRVVVVGGGVMGSACAYSLSRRGGVDVTLIDAGEPFGSSWGESRLARLSQTTPTLLELMRRAKTLWDQLSDDAGGRLLLKETGMLDIGHSDALKAVADTYKACGESFDVMTGDELSKRFPAFRLQDGEQAIFNQGGWVVLAQECVAALREQAVRWGTQLIDNDAVVRVDTRRRTVHTEDGVEVPYDKLVLCAGPWTNKVLQASGLRQLPLSVSCEQQTYFLPRAGTEPQHEWDRMPIFMVRGPANVYGVPHIPGGCQGVKVSLHQSGPIVVSDEHPSPAGFDAQGHGEILGTTVMQGKRGGADHLPGDESKAMTAHVTKWLRNHIPALNTTPAFYYRCMYTTARDKEFLIGVHPQDPDVFMAAAFYGEGFKFATAVGEAVGDMAVGASERVRGLTATCAPARLLQA